MTARPQKIRVKYNRAETRTAWLCLLPSVVGLVCITCLPMIASFALSLFNWNGLGKMTFVGLDNYVKLFTGDSKFYGSLWTTMQYAGMSVVLSIVYSMIIALLLNRKTLPVASSAPSSTCPTCCPPWRCTWAGSGCTTTITAFSTMW